MDEPKKKLKIKLASQERIESLEPYVDKVLDALGFEGALVTDLSIVGDFPFDTDDELSDARAALGIEFGVKDRIYKVAEKLKERLGAH